MSKENKKVTYSPGPWFITDHSWSRIGVYADGECVALLDIYDEATEETQDELGEHMAANACLIASAPDLLAALQGAIRSGIIDTDGSLDAAYAAVAKATGAAK